MSMSTVKVSDKGQISIPIAMRESAGIEKGDELVLLQVDGRIMIEKTNRVAGKMKDSFKDMLKLSEKSLAKVWNNKEDDIWGKYLQ